ncbi:MAG TPA: metalloregulator ArsR/SmtB family transcription factor [Dehalococcoidia bacterium]|nr:metalloregulator ArsR/SmtB family transcription factor [Dehalococcoidia bacterium]
MLEDSENRLYQRHAEMCKVFASPTRLAIINSLREGELNVGDLAKRLRVAKANLSQHLAVMRGQGILVTRKDGNHVFYRVANPKLLQACDLLREILIEQIRAESALVGSARRSRRA